MLKRKKKESLVSETKERPVIGETINFEAYRRLQVNLVRPADLKSTMLAERELGRTEKIGERNWEGMGMFLIMVIFGSIFGLLILSKVDLGSLFEGIGGGGDGGIPTLIRMALRI